MLELVIFARCPQLPLFKPEQLETEELQQLKVKSKVKLKSLELLMLQLKSIFMKEPSLLVIEAKPQAIAEKLEI